MYFPSSRPSSSAQAGFCKRGRLAVRVSIITLPTKKIRSSLTPAWRRFSPASSEVVKK